MTTAAPARTFVLHERVHAAAMLAYVKANASAMAAQGKPLEVRVSVYRERRSNAANALMWVVLQAIADQAVVHGRHYDADLWNVHFKRDLLPDETARGVHKWRYLPDGTRELFMSTSDLDTAEMATYIDQLQAAAAGLGVSF